VISIGASSDDDLKGVECNDPRTRTKQGEGNGSSKSDRKDNGKSNVKGARLKAAATTAKARTTARARSKAPTDKRFRKPAAPVAATTAKSKAHGHRLGAFCGDG
jgi:hypothetical protein